MANLVQVKPIHKKNWHEKVGSESFTRKKHLQALLNPRTMTYATGLNYTDKSYEDPDNPENKITEAAYYEKILKADLSNQFSLETPHPYWDTKAAVVVLENRTQFFDKANPIDYIKLSIMKDSKYVANSMKEVEQGLFPEATHVIVDETEEVEILASKVAMKNQATIAVSKLNTGQKVALILVLTAENESFLKAKNMKGKSDNFIEVELDKIISKKSEQVLRYLKMDKKEIANQALVLEALQKNVLHKQGHRIMYHESLIGQDLLEAVSYLEKPENQELKLRITDQINS